MEITIQAKSKDPQIVSLDSLPRGKFKDLLVSELGEKTSRKILLEMPKDISEKHRANYFKGLKWYIQAAQNKHVELAELSSDEIFSMATVAYFWDDVGPLQLLSTRIVTLVDKCYWVQLAEEPELFFATVEVEMYRRRITRDLDVFPLSKNNDLDLKKFNTDHVDILNGISVADRIRPQPNNTRQVIEDSPAIYWDLVQLSPFDRSFIRDILEDGFVLAGTFVDSCINHRYVLNSLDESFWKSLINNFDKSGRFKGISFDSDDNDNQRHVFSIHFGHFLDDNLPNFMLYLLALFVSVRPGDGFPDEQWLKRIEPIIEGYDLNKAHTKFKELVVVREGELFLKVMKLPKVVDVYSSSSKLLKTMVTELKDSELKVTVNFATSGLILTFKGSDFFYRFIKMEYNSFRDILASIDLDCDRVALRFDKEGALEFAAPQSYINAVNYNICLVNPCNDSSNYFNEVGSAHFRGYTIYLTPGMIASSGTTRDWIMLIDYENPEPQLSLLYELRTVKDTNSVRIPGTNEYLTQRDVVSDCRAVNYQVNNYFYYQIPRKFDILYPLVKKFSESSWFRIRSRDPIQSMYVNYHRDNFLIAFIVYFYRNNSNYKQRGNYINPSYQFPRMKVITDIKVSKEFTEVFGQDEQKKLLTLMGKKSAPDLRQNDLIILDDMTKNAFDNIKELEEEQRIISSEKEIKEERKERQYWEEDWVKDLEEDREEKDEKGDEEEDNDEYEEKGRILDDTIFEPRPELAAEAAAAEPAAVVQQEEEYNGGLDAD
jgi:hypothetical protein